MEEELHFHWVAPERVPFDLDEVFLEDPLATLHGVDVHLHVLEEVANVILQLFVVEETQGFGGLVEHHHDRVKGQEQGRRYFRVWWRLGQSLAIRRDAIEVPPSPSNGP